MFVGSYGTLPSTAAVELRNSLLLIVGEGMGWGRQYKKNPRPACNISIFCGYTAKNIIGNRLSRLNSASLLIKNTISSKGIFLATHSVLLYIIDSKKIFPTMLMGENPWYRRENSTPRLCWEMPTMYRKILMPG